MLNRINEVDNYLNDTILEKLNDEQFSFPYTKGEPKILFQTL